MARTKKETLELEEVVVEKELETISVSVDRTEYMKSNQEQKNKLVLNAKIRAIEEKLGIKIVVKVE